MKPNDTIENVNKQKTNHAQYAMIYRYRTAWRGAAGSGSPAAGRQGSEACLGKGKSRATTPSHEYVWRCWSSIYAGVTQAALTTRRPSRRAAPFTAAMPCRFESTRCYVPGFDVQTELRSNSFHTGNVV